MTDAPTDVNEQVEAEWVEETTPFERVRTVLKRTYEAQSASEIAERARTTPTTARKHLRTLAEDGFVERTATPDRDGTLYKRSNESLVLERANRILSDVDTETLVSRIAEMQNTLQTYRETYGTESPEDAVLTDADIDSNTVQDWQTTRRNLSFAKVALALREAERDLQTEQVV